MPIYPPLRRFSRHSLTIVAPRKPSPFPRGVSVHRWDGIAPHSPQSFCPLYLDFTHDPSANAGWGIPNRPTSNRGSARWNRVGEKSRTVHLIASLNYSTIPTFPPPNDHPPTVTVPICRSHLPFPFAVPICRSHLPFPFAVPICRSHLPFPIVAAFPRFAPPTRLPRLPCLPRLC